MSATRRRSESCLSDPALDRLLAAELSELEQAEARSHLEACSACAARYAEIERDRDAFRMALPERTFVALAARSPARTRGGWWRWAVPAVVACAAIVLVLSLRSHDELGGTRIKGGAKLGFYVDRGGHVAAGAVGEVLHPGDRVRFTITTREPGYLVIASVDASSRITVFYADGQRAAAIVVGVDQLLPDSIELDDTLGRERVVAVFCDHSIAVEQARASVVAGVGELAGCRTDELTWEKRAR
jgi:anti-sigma factor RsiW